MPLNILGSSLNAKKTDSPGTQNNYFSPNSNPTDRFPDENSSLIEDSLDLAPSQNTFSSLIHPINKNQSYISLQSTITQKNLHTSTAITVNRVSGYCRAKAYKIKNIQAQIQSQTRTSNTIYEDCYNSLNKLTNLNSDQLKKNIKNAIFIFDYGVVVIWNMSVEQETVFLNQLDKYADELLSSANLEKEVFSFLIDPLAEPRINNDMITIKNFEDSMILLAFSHAISQSSKLSLFENLVENTINNTKHIPQSLAEHGIVNMSRTALSKKIGQLFIMRVNVSLVSNILDTPEIFWSEPGIQPIYDQALTYLELTQRINLLNHRVSVIGNMLEVLRNHVNGTQG
ncbi:hypothetical protein BB561_002554 [Smittium simulii]|uniref:DUF155 domain-containing protein n=1 Tax=Smittium simulii TaxID=133385 RepID=A0A2T9YPY6_9FUNG|nr:hypothetical protein BB561_002554 [Smittium simulii]